MANPLLSAGIEFQGRLQGPAIGVIKGFVQQEDLIDLQFQAGQLAANLFEGVRA